MSLKNLIHTIDNITRSLKTMDNDHNYIHMGKSFTYHEYFTLATTAVKIFAFTTSITKDFHYRPETVSCSADKLLIELIESPVIAGGTNKLTSIFNRNRKSSNVSTMQTLTSGSTISVDGTTIVTSYIGGGTGVGQSRSGSETGVANEVVLKNNTIYAIRITNNSSTDNVVNIIMKWYEEDLYNFT